MVALPHKNGGFVSEVFGWFFEKGDLKDGFDRIKEQMTYLPPVFFCFNG